MLLLVESICVWYIHTEVRYTDDDADVWLYYNDFEFVFFALPCLALFCFHHFSFLCIVFTAISLFTCLSPALLSNNTNRTESIELDFVLRHLFLFCFCVYQSANDINLSTANHIIMKKKIKQKDERNKKKTTKKKKTTTTSNR